MTDIWLARGGAAVPVSFGLKGVPCAHAACSVCAWLDADMPVLGGMTAFCGIVALCGTCLMSGVAIAECIGAMLFGCIAEAIAWPGTLHDCNIVSEACIMVLEHNPRTASVGDARVPY